MLVNAGVQMTDPEWFQQLVAQLSTEQRKDLDDILRFTDQERSSVQSPCLAALLSAPVVWRTGGINHTRVTLIMHQTNGLYRTLSNNPWLGGEVVSVSDSWSRGRGFDSRPAHHLATTLGKLLTPMCLCHQFGTSQRAVMLCGQEGNPISGAALAGHASHTSVVYPPTGSRPRSTEREMSTPSMLVLEHGPLSLCNRNPSPFFR